MQSSWTYDFLNAFILSNVWVEESFTVASFQKDHAHRSIGRIIIVIEQQILQENFW